MAVIAPGEQSRYRGSRLWCDLFFIKPRRLEPWTGDSVSSRLHVFSVSPPVLLWTSESSPFLMILIKFSLILMPNLRSSTLSVKLQCVLSFGWILLAPYGCLIRCCQPDVIMSAVKVLLRAFLSKVDVCVIKGFFLITYS